MAATGTDGNRSRERMKQEVAYLRATVAQLENELAHLRSQQNVAQVLAVASGGDANVHAHTVANAAWQDIAERQRQLRYAAEVENSKLREYVEDQIRLGKTLEKLLHRKQHAEVESMLSRRPTVRDSTPGATYSVLDDVKVESEMRSSLDELLGEMEETFHHEVFNEPGPFRKIELRFEESRGTFVETSERRILPFSADVAAEAVLMQFRGPNGSVPSHYDSDDTYLYDMAQMVDTARFRGMSRTKMVMRRMLLPGQTIFIFVGLSDPSEALGVPSDGLYVRHLGWARLRELPKPTDDPSSPTISEYTTYHVAIPEVHDVVHDQKRKIGTVTNYVLATIGFQMDLSRENIDNWLLANAANPTTPTTVQCWSELSRVSPKGPAEREV